METPLTVSTESKVKFLDAALHVIRKKGYSATRIEDICAEAGLTKGSFFHHFKTKEDLALKAADHFAAMADGIFASAPYQKATDPLERVLGYIDFRGAILQGELPNFTACSGRWFRRRTIRIPRFAPRASDTSTRGPHALAAEIAEARKRYAPMRRGRRRASRCSCRR